MARTFLELELVTAQASRDRKAANRRMWKGNGSKVLERVEKDLLWTGLEVRGWGSGADTFGTSRRSSEMNQECFELAQEDASFRHSETKCSVFLLPSCISFQEKKKKDLLVKLDLKQQQLWLLEQSAEAPGTRVLRVRRGWGLQGFGNFPSVIGGISLCLMPAS